MTRFMRLVLVLACLACFPAAGLACQLSLVGTVMQRPLTFNPFEAGATAAAVSFTLKNADSKPCDAAFAFFKAGVPQASAAGNSLTYQLMSSSGQLIQNAPSPPAVLPGSGYAAYFHVGAKQTYTANAMLSVAGGQVVPPGTYTDTLYLGVYQSAGGGHYTRTQIPASSLGVIIGVNSQMTISVAGGGLRTTMNFGVFVEGATRAVQLQAYANQGFHLIVSSENAGVMKLVDAAAASGGVPYTVAIAKLAPVDLTQQRAVSLWPAATQKSGVAIPIDVQVGSIAGQRAGTYRDVITIAIDAGP